jgi:inner membrane protein
LDTGTHLVVGLGLAGLAFVDPVVAADPTTATAVLIGTVLGSQAPDSDTLLRFKSNAAYVKNHRGLSHSIPAVLIWTLLITFSLGLFFNPLPLWNVGFWVLLAVSFHVFSDCFNTYGTQAARPFTEKWVAWNIIHIFDPIIFSSHVIAIFIWSVRLAEPAAIFSILYSFTVLYYIWRTLVHYSVRNKLPQKDEHYTLGDEYLAIPTINLYVWNIVKKKKDGSYVTGELRNQQLQWVDRVKCADHPAVDKSRSHPDIDAFIYLSPHACAEFKKHSWGYEVRWFDVRYRHRKQYPFVAVLLMDLYYKPLNSYVGWLSEEKMEKRLRLDT